MSVRYMHKKISSKELAKKRNRKICGNCEYWIERGFNDGICEHPQNNQIEEQLLSEESCQKDYWGSCDYFRKDESLK